MKSNFLRKIENSKSKQIVFCILSVFVIMLVYFVCMLNIRKNNQIKSYLTQRIKEDYNVLTSIENVVTRDGEIEFTGWGLRLESKNIGIKVILDSGDKKSSEVLDANTYEREDITEYFNSSSDFGKCGFEASIKEKDLKEDTCYEIILLLEYEDQSIESKGTETDITSVKVSTNQYIRNGELFRYNPDDFVNPAITDQEVLGVVSEGILRYYDIENQIWLYQYEGFLYMILNNINGTLQENNLVVPMFAYTSQVELLPEERIQYGRDHLGGHYEEEEFLRDGVLPYQIVKVKMPTDYPVTLISTGIYDGSTQEWLIDFRVPMADWIFLNNEDIICSSIKYYEKHLLRKGI